MAQRKVAYTKRLIKRIGVKGLLLGVDAEHVDVNAVVAQVGGTALNSPLQVAVAAVRVGLVGKEDDAFGFYLFKADTMSLSRKASSAVAGMAARRSMLVT